jgi:tripartite-type tricarboxylate transporter receptor subunit TctC
MTGAAFHEEDPIMVCISKFIRLLLVALALIAMAGSAWAQAYPSRAIRFVLPFPPGGPTDVLGRLIAQQLTEQLGQQVVPDNRPGLAGNIGLELAARAKPDGYTMVLSAPPIAISPSLYTKLGYDALQDLAPISLVAEIQNIMMVHHSVPAKSLKEFIALATRYPGKVNFSSSGAGSTNHLANELLKTMFKLDMVHVPYKGGAAQLVALMSGEVDMAIMAVPAAVSAVKADKVRPLAVLSERRVPALPHVPTAKEAGIDGFVVTIWYGVLAPAGTPRSMIDRLNSEIRKAMLSPALKAPLAANGVEPRLSTPDEFASFIKSEMGRYAKIIKAAGIKPVN